MTINFFISKYFRCVIITVFVVILTTNIIFLDIDIISDFFYKIVSGLNSNNFFSLILVFLLFILRSTSIIIPVLPGTIFSAAAGFQFGFTQGLIIIFFADFFSCSISFMLARKLGRSYISRLLGSRQMRKVESISQDYLENNYFLMTALLMSGFFDFVCYAIGLTKITWKRFMPALIFSIIISDSPFVASGFAARKIKDIGLKNFLQKILNGELDMISGNYLFLFITSFLIIFTLAIINIYLNKKSNIIK
ncbi:TVP38/TMEM64 family protein [Prochlorococcus marinus]|uniref:TVP38/TMEM64 family protein n=1 Tax=Prochlorococcus marinus TaxID=1219 RepID=UPI0022B58006|nr:VTT domain-containing protein [Prochlorococcus marinus]